MRNVVVGLNELKTDELASCYAARQIEHFSATAFCGRRYDKVESIIEVKSAVIPNKVSTVARRSTTSTNVLEPSGKLRNTRLT